MSDVSLDVKRLVVQAYAVAKSGGVKDPRSGRHDLATAWGFATEAHFAKLAAACSPRVVPTPRLMVEFLKYLSSPKAQLVEAA